MIAQEVFDKVVNHLRQQGQKSIDDKGDCVYRGNKEANCRIQCAAGCLIEDNEYLKNMEGRTITELLNSLLVTREMRERLEPHVLLIRKLQIIHDENWRGSWEELFKECANKFSLEYKELQKGI